MNTTNNSINILSDRRDKLKIDLLKQQKHIFEIENEKVLH